MPTVTSARISVSQFFDCAMAQQTAREIAHKQGFAAQPTEEIVLVVTELAAHMARHTGSGVLTIRLLDNDCGIGIEIEAENHDPGIRDPEHLFREGESAGAVLDSGLGTVQHLMDDREISSTASLGTRILCRRWLLPKAGVAIIPPWQVGIATRPCHMGAANGDA